MYHVIRRKVILNGNLENDKIIASDRYEMQDLPTAIEFIERQYKTDRALYRLAAKKCYSNDFIDDSKDECSYDFVINDVKIECFIEEDIQIEASHLFLRVCGLKGQPKA